MRMTNVKIVVAYHRAGLFVQSEQLIPVHVGSKISTLNLGIQRDDEGDNVSEKNPIYCELTALYWIWKNVKAEYKGLAHYRRCLCFGKKHFYGWKTEKLKHNILRVMIGVRKPYETSLQPYIEYSNESDFVEAAKYFADQIALNVRNDVAIITSVPIMYFPYSVYQHFAWDIDVHYYRFLLDIVRDNYPDFYPWLESTSNGHTLYSGNISIMRNDIFDDYCAMLFDIVAKHEQKVVADGFITDPMKDKSYSRVSGYLAEMITNAYIHKIKSENKVLEYPIAFLK